MFFFHPVFPQNKHCKELSIPEYSTGEALTKYVKAISESLNFDSRKIFDSIDDKIKKMLGLEDKHVEQMKEFQRAEEEGRAKKAEKKRQNKK